jgi:hypothetical protein
MKRLQSVQIFPLVLERKGMKPFELQIKLNFFFNLKTNTVENEPLCLRSGDPFVNKVVVLFATSPQLVTLRFFVYGLFAAITTRASCKLPLRLNRDNSYKFNS